MEINSQHVTKCDARKAAAYVPKQKRGSPILPPDPSKPLPPDYTWYLLEVAPNWEYRVAHWLESMGFAAIVPLETKQRIAKSRTRGAGQKKTALEYYQIPLIPRMVAIGSCGPIPWFVILEDEIHHCRAVGVDGSPVPMRRGGAERLRSISEVLRRQAAPKPLKKAGKAIVIKSGMLIPAGRVVDIADLPNGPWAAIKNCLDVAPDRVFKVRKDSLEAA